MDLLKDNPKSLFYRYLLPAIGGTLVFTIYSFVDMIAIGHGVGPDGTAATAIILPIFQLPSFLSILCGIGGSVLIAKEKGRNNSIQADKWFTASFLCITVSVFVIWILSWLFRVEILTFFGADSTILPYALEYGNMIILGFPFFTFAGYLPFILRNDGNPDLPLLASIAGGVINMIGDWLFVFPLNMGMFGAGLATLIGSAVQCVILCSHFYLGKCSLRFRKPAKLSVIFPYGFGSAFIELSTIVSTVITNRMIMKYCGNKVLTVYGFMLTVVALAQFLFLGIGQAAQPIISMNFGAGLNDRVKQTAHLNIKISVAFALIFTVIGHTFPLLITQIFVKNDPQVLAVAPHVIRMYLLSLPFLALNTAEITNLQSVSQDAKANTITILRGLVFNSGFIILFPLIFGANGIWWGIIASEAFVCGLALIFSTLP